LFEGRKYIIVIVGAISGNLTILDADSPEAAEYYKREFERRGLKPWVVSTNRGLHFYWLSDVELSNVPKPSFMQITNQDAEIIARVKYVLAPPSVHPSGVIYTWAYRDGPKPPRIPVSELEGWLPVSPYKKSRRKPNPLPVTDDPFSCLSNANREFIHRGAQEGTRNNRLFSAACDLQANGFSLYEAREILLGAGVGCGLEKKEILSTLNSAYSKEREPARKPEDAGVRRVPPFVRAALWARDHTWKRMEWTVNFPDGTWRRYAVTAQTARAVFGACIHRAECDYSDVFRATTREVAELADVNRDTANRALQCLVGHGYLNRCGYAEFSHAGLYAFTREVLQDGDSNTITGSQSTVPFLQQGKHPYLTHDVWHRSAMAKSGKDIYLCLLESPIPLTQSDIATKIDPSSSTVSRRLRKLKQFGMVDQDDKVRWDTIILMPESLDNVARACGTLGAGQRRRDIHMQQRAIDVTVAILRRMGKATPG